MPLHAFVGGGHGAAASDEPASGTQQVAFTLKSEEPRFALSLIAALARVRQVSLPIARLREGNVLAEEIDGGSLSSRLPRALV